MKRDSGRRWYLTALSAVYLALCSAGCLHNLFLDLSPNGETVPVLQQALCLAFTIAAGTYFVRAKAGHVALVVLTVLALIGIGHSDPRATVLHLFVLLILALPLIQGQHPSTRSHVEVN